MSRTGGRRIVTCQEGEINIVLVPLVIGIQGVKTILHLTVALGYLSPELWRISGLFCNSSRMALSLSLILGKHLKYSLKISCRIQFCDEYPHQTQPCALTGRQTNTEHFSKGGTRHSLHCTVQLYRVLLCTL